jgi:hypothetical protein
LARSGNYCQIIAVNDFVVGVALENLFDLAALNAD